MWDSSHIEIEVWLGKMELKYIKLALEVAKYEDERDFGSGHDNYVEMDRLEKDIERAHEGIVLCRKHFEKD